MIEIRMYPPTPPEGVEPPACVVSYPEACECPAVGEVWSLPFCEAHGREAVIAARLEAHDDATRELAGLLGNVDGGQLVRNPLVRAAIEDVDPPVLGDMDVPGTFPERVHERAIAEAFDLDEALTDTGTLNYHYCDEIAGDGPHDWWLEARELVVRFMRQADEAAQPQLLKVLERFREEATVQQELARIDFERRWVKPRCAELERRWKEAAHRPVE